LEGCCKEEAGRDREEGSNRDWKKQCNRKKTNGRERGTGTANQGREKQGGPGRER